MHHIIRQIIDLRLQASRTRNTTGDVTKDGDCGHLQLKSEGSLEPLNAAALPEGGLRQDHHGTEQMPVTPGSALPYHAMLTPFAPNINTTGGGVISLLVAPDNSSIVCSLKLLNRCALGLLNRFGTVHCRE